MTTEQHTKSESRAVAELMAMRAKDDRKRFPDKNEIHGMMLVLASLGRRRHKRGNAGF
jgi:hypothetical protein